MLGAIIGDTVGSRFEWNNNRSKDFEFFHSRCELTDDSILTLAVAKALLTCSNDYSDLSDKTVYWMQLLGNRYPNRGYGGRFYGWLNEEYPMPYNSFGNGSAMRTSPVAYASDSLDEVKKLSEIVASVTHNHPEGIKGAEAVSVAIFMALHGADKEEIKETIERDYYRLNFTIDELRPTYEFSEICQTSVPQALEAFFESESFEDAIRTAISLGGDSDTIAAITGSIAEAYYGIPEDLIKGIASYIDPYLTEIYDEFRQRFIK